MRRRYVRDVHYRPGVDLGHSLRRIEFLFSVTQGGRARSHTARQLSWVMHMAALISGVDWVPHFLYHVPLIVEL